ncbi:YgjV family protein [Azospirillum rugosum]|uniref:Inner membrane protein n=1 Tax=Azospirillum rugosum TaxID=416170 RepID=A0ABS4SEQ6_9PROT|nr:YgjV family protein [Azospirillum rugosum]MBP2291058.1 hypothetical protein [Azospirillum rugosum]MDQ0524878.1 hypothetical protein [Azospirillum rugosum]
MTAADLFGGVGLALVAAWPWLTGRRALLAGQGASALAFALHYASLGAATGAAMSGLSVAQVAVAWADTRPRWRGALYAATAPALAVLVGWTWAGPESACAAAGLAFAMAARWARTAHGLRLLSMGSAWAWLAHDIIAGSVFGFVADVACMVGLAVGVLRARERLPRAE